jgi:hypothetical protein
MKRLPLSIDMKIGEAATLAVQEFLKGVHDFALFEVGLEVNEDGKSKLVAVRFTITAREIASLSELLPSTPRH